jgi:Serpin (serine protease inhibitor)
VLAAIAVGCGDDRPGFALLRTQPATENAVLSPASVGHALSMARAAAGAEAASAIDSALALPDGLAAHQAWNAIDQQIAAAVPCWRPSADPTS